MVHRRHIDQVTSGKRNVRGDARAFLAERFFRNLYQDLLPFPEQFGNCGPGLWGISIRPMFLLLNRGRTTAASAPAAAGRTMREAVIVGAIRNAGARRSFRFPVGTVVFLGLFCLRLLLERLPCWWRRFCNHAAFGCLGRNRRRNRRRKVRYRRRRRGRFFFGDCA